MTQRSEIVNDETLPAFNIGGNTYKGRHPLYQNVNGGWMKVSRGVPFVKLTDEEIESLSL